MNDPVKVSNELSQILQRKKKRIAFVATNDSLTTLDVMLRLFSLQFLNNLPLYLLLAGLKSQKKASRFVVVYSFVMKPFWKRRSECAVVHTESPTMLHRRERRMLLTVSLKAASISCIRMRHNDSTALAVARLRHICYLLKCPLRFLLETSS